MLGQTRRLHPLKVSAILGCMSGRFEGQRSITVEVANEAVVLPLPVDVRRVMWRRDPAAPIEGEAHYLNPLVITARIDADEDGGLHLMRVQAVGNLGSVGPLPGGPWARLSVESPGVTHALGSDRPQRPLDDVDLRVIANLSSPEVLGAMLVDHAAAEKQRSHMITGADFITAQARAGGKRARATDEDFQLIADAVRKRAFGQTAAAAVQAIPNRKWGRARAYELVNEAVRLGYIHASDKGKRRD